MSELELEDIQGLLAWGYGRLPAAALHLLEFGEARAAGAWLDDILPTVTCAAGGRPTEEAVNLALTTTGLEQLRVPATTLAGFSNEFRGGMTTPHRRRLLGDAGDSAPEQWQWGGPGTPTVHAVLALYAATASALAGLEQRELARLDAHGIGVVHRLDTAPLSDREPFGFRDGISQPSIRGLGDDDPQAVAAGEFVLGYRNEYGLYTDRPTLDPDEDPDRTLPRDPEDDGRADLGRNGSYLVVRQLEQDVPGFWRFAEQAAQGNGDGGGREALAARLVGRWPSGAPLVLSPDGDDPSPGARRSGEANAFDYAHMDPDGRRCPLGAHIRRSNPRDSLDPDPGSEASLALNRRHRLIRRGRAYGTPVTPEQALAGASDDARGLHFACLCGNLARQFEFVQHTWVNNPKFNGLYEDPDPLIGPPGGTLTIQARPVRRRLTDLPQFVSVRGGAYFFLPGLRALAYLAAVAQRPG